MIGDVINDQFNAANDQPLGAALGVVLMASFGLVFLITGFRRSSDRA
jgi:ABC-type spermidine/putrescine transport system permease subunit I